MIVCISKCYPYKYYIMKYMATTGNQIASMLQKEYMIIACMVAYHSSTSCIDCVPYINPKSLLKN